MSERKVCNNNLLFCTSANRKYTASSIYQQIGRVIESNEDIFNVSMLKKSYPAFMSMSNVDFAVISLLFGENNKEVSDLYMYIAKEGLKEKGKLWEDI